MCKDFKKATRKIGRENALDLMSTIDKITYLFANLGELNDLKTFNLHELSGNLKGFYAIDIRNRRNKYRLIFQPLNDNLPSKENLTMSYDAITIIEIKEVSNHYE